MGFLRKNLFRLLIVAASLGIADAAFAQAGDGIEARSLDSVLRTVTTPIFTPNLDGTLSSSIAPASLTAAFIGRHGFVALTNSSLGTGATLTTSIAAIPYPTGGRVTVDIYTNNSATIPRCNRITITGFDWKGSPKVYTYGPLLALAPHTSSVAFSSISRFRADECYNGTTGGTTPASTQIRVFMSRHVALPFRIQRQSELLKVCRHVLTANVQDVCLRGTSYIGGGTALCSDQAQSNCAFRVFPQFNTVYLPTASQVAVDGNSSNAGQTTSLVDDSWINFQFRATKN